MTLRVLVCIPTFDNPGTIAEVVRDALAQLPHSVLVVDDGSARDVRELVAESERVTIVRHARNLGKGAALQTAFGWALARGYTHLVTLDGDGQHFAREATRLIDEARRHPFDLVIGKRRLHGEHVPGITHFGRGFSNFWVKFQTGMPIEDSQSGYRLYPLFRVQNWRFWTKRYDFEIEVLIRMLWCGAGVREVDIDVHYPPRDERVSHFDKFWDNARISLLNAVLVVLSLLKYNREPRKTGLALGLGAFIGCTPFFGLHALIATGIAFVFRLNALYTFIGSNVSIPPIAAVLVPAEIALGKAILPGTGWGDSLAGWLLGSVLIGTVVGTTVGLIGWWTTKRLAKPASNWTGRTRGGRLGNGFLKLLIRTLGVRAGYFCLWFMIPYFYVFAPRARRSCHEYWRIRRPGAGWFTRFALTLRQLFRFGQVLMDRAYQSFSPTSRFRLNSNGMQNIAGPVADRVPLVMATAHVGGWDLATAVIRKDGFSGSLNVLHYRSEGYTFEKVIGQVAPHLRSVVANQDPILLIKEILDRGEPVGLMADRPSTSGFELVPFFGKLIPFDAKPFRIAAACRASLLFTFGFKGGDDSYDFYAFPARPLVYAPDRPRPEQVFEWVRAYAEQLEALLERYPEQWFNFFPAFSSPPKPPPGMQAATERHHLREEWRTPANPAPESAPGPKTSDEPESRA